MFLKIPILSFSVTEYNDITFFFFENKSKNLDFENFKFWISKSSNLQRSNIKKKTVHLNSFLFFALKALKTHYLKLSHPVYTDSFAFFPFLFHVGQKEKDSTNVSSVRNKLTLRATSLSFMEVSKNFICRFFEFFQVVRIYIL